jgi:hypothetical protein
MNDQKVADNTQYVSPEHVKLMAQWVSDVCWSVIGLDAGEMNEYPKLTAAELNKALTYRISDIFSASAKAQWGGLLDE